MILADQAGFLSRWSSYLSARLGTPATFLVRDSYQAILDLLFGGQLDAAWICGFPYVRHAPRLRLVAVPLYRHQPYYQSYLIRARQEPSQGVPIRSWADLRGKVFAYSDPLSNSGWLVAQFELASAGLTAHDLKRSFFAHGHRNVAEAVAARLAHAGSIDGYVWETMRKHGMSATAQTEVVWKSQLHGFPPLVTAIGADPLRNEALQDVLLGMNGNDLGRSLLDDLNLTGFVAGDPKLFDSIRHLARSVPDSGVSG